jgi:hypothetical protein
MDLVDTDVLIDVQRGHPPAVAWFASLMDLPDVPGFVVMELIQDARNATEVTQALKLVAPLFRKRSLPRRREEGGDGELNSPDV